MVETRSVVFCPICKSKTTRHQCAVCGYDSSMDYERWGSFGTIPAGMQSGKRMAELRGGERSVLLRCSLCGNSSMTFGEEEGIHRCSQCGRIVLQSRGGEKNREEMEGLRRQLQEALREKNRLLWECKALQQKRELLESMLSEANRKIQLQEKTEDFRDKSCVQVASLPNAPGVNTATPHRNYKVISGSKRERIFISGDGRIRQDSYSSRNFDIPVKAPIAVASFGNTYGILTTERRVKVVNSFRTLHHGAEGWTDIVALGLGRQYVVGLSEDGKVHFCGASMFGEGDARAWEKIVDIRTGSNFVLGLKKDGTATATGRNADGQCNVGFWKNIVSIDAGNFHAVGLTNDGRVLAAGYNEDGQCRVETWRNIVAISAGARHTVGLLRDGSVVAIGNNSAGQCDVSGWRDIVAIQATEDGTVGWKMDGGVVLAGETFGVTRSMPAGKIRKPDVVYL